MVIYDADNDFKKTRKHLLSERDKYDIEFDLFLFPYNQDAGDIEDLLINIINPGHSGIINCFNGYKECIINENPNYKLPDNKAMLYAYCESLRTESQFEKNKLS